MTASSFFDLFWIAEKTYENCEICVHLDISAELDNVLLLASEFDHCVLDTSILHQMPTAKSYVFSYCIFLVVFLQGFHGWAASNTMQPHFWIVTALSISAWQSERWYCLEKPWLNDTAKQNPGVHTTTVLLLVQDWNQSPRCLTWSRWLHGNYDDVFCYIINKTFPNMKVFHCKWSWTCSKNSNMLIYNFLQNQMAQIIVNSHIMQTCGKPVWSSIKLCW